MEYKDLPGIKHPIIHVELVHNKKTVKAPALVDSGATATFIPKRYAKILNLDLTGDENPGIGVGAKFEYKSTKIDQISLFKIPSTTYEEFKNPTVHVLEYGAIPCILLGRDLIFKKFAIEFIENQQKIILRRTPRQQY